MASFKSTLLGCAGIAAIFALAGTLPVSAGEFDGVTVNILTRLVM